MSSPPSPPVLIHRVIARLNVGGPAMHVTNLAAALNHGPWSTRLVAGHIEEEEGDMAYYAEERGVEVTYVPAMARSISPLADLKTLWGMYRLFRSERPDVVHTHTAKAGTLGRIAGVLARVPVVIHTYHGHVLGGDYFAPWKMRFFLEVERQLAKFTDRLVVLTNRQARQMADELRIARSERFSVVPLGLELDRFLEVDREAQRGRMREELGIGLDELVVGIVGRMVPIKNHELFLDLLPELFATAHGSARALVVGSGERESILRARAEALGVHDRVTWLGWRRDLPRLYPAMDVLLLTPHDEGTPVAVFEALVTGTPVVARDVGGVAEVLVDSLGAGPAGVVVPRDASLEMWAAAAIRAAAAPALSRERRAEIARHFSVERLADDIAGLYAQEMR